MGALTTSVLCMLKLNIFWAAPVVKRCVNKVGQITADVLPGETPSGVHVVVEEDTRTERVVGFRDLENGARWFVEHQLAINKLFKTGLTNHLFVNGQL